MANRRDLPGAQGTGALDPGLRDRVMDRSAEFEEAFTAAATRPSPEALDHLREAVDELMRAAGRVLVEIERLADEPDDPP